MDLSKELIQQFIDVTTQDKEVQNGVTLYGTIKTQGSEKFVIIDGSDQLTPIKATTFVSDGERVTVMIKNHQAIVTGNITSPAARQPDVEDTVGDKISEYDVIITETIEAQNAKIGDLVAENIEISGDLTAVNGTIEQLKSENVEITGKLNANEAEIKKLKTDKLDADTANITFATIENLKATNIEVNNIKGNHADFADLTAQKFEAVNADIENLEVNKLSASEADLKYANIDFANIGKVAIENLFAQSGLIKDLVVGDQHITGELVGVTIKGDLIEGGTIVADKLVVKGSDGLYYKLNTDGMKVEAEQTEYNSLNGSIITAKSITATKVNVDDLVAFDATIGGFKITDNSIHSGVKSSVDNATRGVYLDNTGQVAFGDGNSFLKYFKDSDGKWKLVVSANSVKLSASDTTVEDALDDMNNKIDNTPKSVEEHFAVSSNPTTVPTSGWSTTPPVWQNGKYIWSKMVTTYVDGRISESKPVCITGAKGQDGTSGSAGKGIKFVTNYYLATNVNTGVSESTSGWTETVQTITSTKKYLWNYEKITYTDNTTTKTTPVIIGVYGDKGQNGAAGADGQAGADGVGIKSITEKYAVSTSNTTAPTSWHDTVQTMTATNRYLWNYEIVTYTNNTTSETSKRVIGVYGDKGNTGATGKGIKTVSNYYLATNTSSGVTPETSGWTTMIQSISSTKKYLWNYELITYTDNSTTKTTPVIIGAYGDKGNTGATGANGQDGLGIKSIVEKYAVSNSNSTAPTTWHDAVQNMTATNKYLWNYEIITYTNNTTTQTAKRVIGVYGDKGNTGATGPAGKGVKSVTNYYLATNVNTGVTDDTSGWTTSIQTITATKKYLWNYEKITYTDNTTTKTTPVIIGVYGDKGQNGAAGATGNGIKTIVEKYAVSTSNTTAPTTWYDAVQVMTATNRYLWNYEIITYTNGSTSETSKRVIGVYGDKGQTGATGSTGATGPQGPAGKGVKSITNYYLVSTASSGVTTSTSGWSTTVQNMTASNRYLWNYEKVTYTDNSTTTTIPVVIGVYGDKGNTGATGATGPTGPTGATGNGIKTITEYYLISANKTGVTTSTTGWSTTIPTLTATNKYLWNYEKITYTNGSSSTGSPKIIGVYGDKGNTGATGPTGPTGPAGVGIKSVDVEYYLSTSSTTQSGGSWSTTAPAWVNGKYMWSRTKTVTTDGTTKYSSPACITGQKGSTGATGSTGPTGATGQGVQSITEEYYLSTSKTSQTGGSWVTTSPTWSTGKYLWTRSKIVYKNPTSTTYTTPVCDSSWEAVNDVEIGGRNYISHGKGDKREGFFKYFNKVENDYGEHTLTSKKRYVSVNIASGFLLGCRDYEVGKQVTISYDFMYTVWDFPSGTDRKEFWIGQRYTQASSTSSNGAWRGVTKHDLPVVGENGCELNKWIHVEKTMTIPSQADTTIGTASSIQFYNSNANISASITFRIKNVKIEYGNKATDWTPAPEDLEARVTTAELELKPDKILQKVNTQIGAGGKIDTVSTILDKTGFTIKNGAIKVQNKSGQTVLSGDTNGNLWVQNSVKVGGGTNGAIEMFNSKNTRVGLMNQTGFYLNDGLFNVTSGAITQSGIGSYPEGIEKKTTINSDKMICKEVEMSGSQVYTYLGEHGTFETKLITDFLGSSTGTYKQTRLNSDQLSIYLGEGTSDFDKGTKTIINATGVETTNVNVRKINCTSMIDTIGFKSNQYITIKNTNHSAADSNYIEMLRSNGTNGAKLTSGDNGLGLRLHLYNNSNAWSTHYIYRENGWFSTPYLEVRGTRIELGKEGDNSAFMAFYDTTKTRRGYIGKGSNSSNNIYLYSESSDGNITISSGNNYVHVKGHLTPLWDNTYYLGTTSPGYRWKQLCATTTSIATSDSRYKKNIKPIVENNDVMLLRETSTFDINPPESDQAVTKDYHDFIKNRFQPYSYEYLTEDNELDANQGFKLTDKEKMAKSIGFIADEYDLDNDKVAKEFIFRTEDGMLNYNTGNYATVIAIALQEEIRLRDEQIKERDKKIEDLEQRLTKLEQLLLK